MGKEKIGLATAIIQLTTAMVLRIQALKSKGKGRSKEWPPL